MTHYLLAILATVLLCACNSSKDQIGELRKEAEKGNASAQFTLGKMYASGEEVPKCRAEAVKWIYKAAHQGHLEAQAQLGEIYLKGLGVPRDEKEAMKWIRKAADQAMLPDNTHWA